jgi:predicted nuclease of restriction endonuclease-like (RecB) superfamily
MVQFYEAFPKEEIVATLSQQLTWSHIKEIISVKDELKREFYATMCSSERWSVRTLRERIASMMYERTAISKKPELTIINDLKQLREENKMSPGLFFKDPYVLDFLGLEDTYSEKDLENAILAELEKFILEMGIDFAFLGRQKRITVDNRDYYIDLLFYHRRMRRLVVIELKLEEFKPEHKGQVELYLRWLNKYERMEGEESPLALILCAEKSSETIELLELDNSGIHVAQYLTQMPPKEVFEAKLHKAIQKARLQLEQRGQNSEV